MGKRKCVGLVKARRMPAIRTACYGPAMSGMMASLYIWIDIHNRSHGIEFLFGRPKRNLADSKRK